MPICRIPDRHTVRLTEVLLWGQVLSQPAIQPLQPLDDASENVRSLGKCGLRVVPPTQHASKGYFNTQIARRRPGRPVPDIRRYRKMLQLHCALLSFAAGAEQVVIETTDGGINRVLLCSRATIILIA